MPERIKLNDLTRLRKTELAYVAGIIDGEGCISLNKNRQTGYMALHLSVANTDELLADYLHSLFGGHRYVNRRSKRGPKHKNVWYWSLYAENAVTILKLILPYLKLKRPQVELAIEFQKRRPFGRCSGIKKAKSVLDEAQHILMSQYNKGGIESGRKM